MICTVSGCERAVRCRGYCGMHYQRANSKGDPGAAGPVGKLGPNNPKWRGGRRAAGEKGRYWDIYSPDHPRASKGGYVLEHRLVMEASLGRFLETWEVVHHLNGDPADNRLENLSVTTQTEHARDHSFARRRDDFGRFT